MSTLYVDSMTYSRNAARNTARALRALRAIAIDWREEIIMYVALTGVTVLTLWLFAYACETAGRGF
jgi:hypothetical protein